MKVRLKKENVMALELFTMVMEGKFIMDIGKTTPFRDLANYKIIDNLKNK